MCFIVSCQVCLQVASATEKWKTAIREAQTFSRMHVLLGMLDACIKWDMSAENARCKVCRKKGRHLPHADTSPCPAQATCAFPVCPFASAQSFGHQDSQPEALISWKYLTLMPINPSYETRTQSCRALQSCYPLGI